MIPHVHVETSRPTGDTIQRAAPISAFTDRDGPMLRASVLLKDSDEFGQTGQRVRIFRNGQHHFCVCECSITGRPHPSIVRMVPDAIGVPGCSVIVTIPDDQVDTLLEGIR